MRNSSGIPQRSGLFAPLMALAFTFFMFLVLYVVPTVLFCMVAWHFITKFW